MDDIFKKFKKLKVLVIGDVMVDSYLWGDVERISPEAPIPVVSIAEKEHRLGGAANVALNIIALGAKPILCSIIGDDEEGTLFNELLEDQGISNDYIIRSKDRKTTTKTRILSRNHQMFRYDSETTEYIDDDAADSFIKLIQKALEKEKVNVVAFQDYNKGILSEKVIVDIIQKCIELDIPTIADPKRVNFLSYRECTIFKPNLKETIEGLSHHFSDNNYSIDADNAESLNKATSELNMILNNQITIITLSDKGIFVNENQQGEFVSTQPRRVSDVSGAGDTVLSVIALCTALKVDVIKMVKLANIAGGLVCEEVGVVPVDLDKLIKEASQQIDD